MNWKYLLIYSVALVAVSVATTRYYWPMIETKTKIEEKEIVRTDVKTVIKEVVRPDGTKETVTEIIDKSQERRTKELEQITLKRKDWYLAVGAHTDFKGVEPSYSIQANRRILGPAYLGIQVKSNKEVGVLVGLEF